MKRKIISKEKRLNVLKYVAIVLGLVLALGLIGSLFTGNSDGDGVKAPSINRPTVETPEESTDNGSLPESDTVPETETEAPAPQMSNYRVYLDNFRINETDYNKKDAINEPIILFNSVSESSYCSDIKGWFMIEGGTDGYTYRGFNRDTGEITDLIIWVSGVTMSATSSNGAYMNIATQLGLGEDALTGCVFEGRINYEFLSSGTWDVEV